MLVLDLFIIQLAGIRVVFAQIRKTVIFLFMSFFASEKNMHQKNFIYPMISFFILQVLTWFKNALTKRSHLAAIQSAAGAAATTCKLLNPDAHGRNDMTPNLMLSFSFLTKILRIFGNQIVVQLYFGSNKANSHYTLLSKIPYRICIFRRCLTLSKQSRKFWQQFLMFLNCVFHEICSHWRLVFPSN